MDRWTSTIDAGLVLRCQQGDARAFSALVDRWHPRLLRHAGRLVGDADGAADVAQETWIAAIASLARLDDVDAFGTWLFRILTRKSIDWVRRKQRRRSLWDRLRQRAAQSEPTSPSPVQRMESHASCASVQGAIQMLPPEQAEVIALHYLEEFSVQQIAEIVGAPPGTIRSRLHYARLRLRELLKESDDAQRPR